MNKKQNVLSTKGFFFFGVPKYIIALQCCLLFHAVNVYSLHLYAFQGLQITPFKMKEIEDK